MAVNIGYPGGFFPTAWKGSASDLYPKIREKCGWIWNGLRCPARSFRYEFADELLELVAANWPTPWSPRRRRTPKPKPPTRGGHPSWPSDAERHRMHQKKVEQARQWHFARSRTEGRTT